MYPAGELDLEDSLIYSLGLGSTGHDYSTNTLSPSPPSNTTRRRRQSIEERCPNSGTNGYICHSIGIHEPMHVMNSVFRDILFHKF